MHLVLTLALVGIATCLVDRSQDDVDVVEAENQSCDTVFCSMGKECVMENGKPDCACIERCVGRPSPVCGSIGHNLITYKSECHLYKDDCERENVTITKVSDKPCDVMKQEDHEISDKIEKDKKKVKPVVCMENDRNKVRQAIIEWISAKLKFKPDSVSYKGIIMKYFFSLDLNNDKTIDTAEFTELIEKDPSITKVLDRGNRDSRELKGLCSNELIAIADKNSDYKLGFEEFYTCLDPTFKPKKEMCELGGDVYEDGQDVPAECGNSCKCSCGLWVCTAAPCDKGSEDGNRVEDRLNVNGTAGN